MASQHLESATLLQSLLQQNLAFAILPDIKLCKKALQSSFCRSQPSMQLTAGRPALLRVAYLASRNGNSISRIVQTCLGC